MDPLQDQLDVIDQPEDQPEEYSAEDIATCISHIVTDIDRTERSTRNRMLRLWKYLELLWSGAGNYYWDHQVGQWRAITQEDIALLANESDIDPTLINKVVNLIRPYGESLVGVLTTGLPRVKFFPRNADKELDIQSAKAHSNIEKRIVDDNMMPLRMMEILVKMWNGGFAAIYNYSHTDAKYGTIVEDVKEERNYSQESLICSECGNETQGDMIPEIENVDDDMSPDTPLSPDEMLDTTPPEIPPSPSPESIPLEIGGMPPEMSQQPDMPEMKMAFCSQCEANTPHLSTTVMGRGPVTVDQNVVPKSRQMIKVYGPMNVKIPSMATCKEQITWLILEEELYLPQAKHLYPDHRDKIQTGSGSDIDIDRISRTYYEVAEDTLKECATIRKVWLTPAEFERESDIKKVEYLKKTFPNGVMSIFCADKYLEGEEQDLHDHWTITINPLYPRLMADPLGKALIGLHETANDIFQLEVDTFRFSIPQTFFDPKYLDAKAYQQQRSLPGSLVPMKGTPPGGKMGDVFFETRTATVPKEVENLNEKVERLLQFVSGVLPSVFGGAAGGGKTLGEYEQSRNQALQRLSIPWKVVCVAYAEMMAKAVKCYKEDLKEDEFFVKEQGQGTFMNVWIRKEELKGEIGEVRPELSEQFPMTWGQISQKVMDLLTLNNQTILSWFFHPENIELIYSVLGVSDLYIPGEDQRNKQLYEISQLIISQPTPIDQIDQNGQPITVSSVPIEPFDDDAVHMEVTRAFLNSPVGIDLKETNPIAYQNVAIHYQEHAQRLAQQQQAQMEAEKQTKAPSEPVQES